VLLFMVRNRLALSPKRLANAHDRADSMVGGEAEIDNVGFCSIVGVLCRGLTPQGGGAKAGSSTICHWAVEHDMLFPWPQLKG
jgi:hypothetical protein